MRDLFVAYLTSWGPLALSALGLFLLGAAVSPEDYPHERDAAAGIAAIALSFTLVPIGMIWITGANAAANRPITLHFTEDGIDGWPTDGGYTLWRFLHRPRLERGLLILPFQTLGSGRRNWIIIPVRCLSDEERAAVLDVLREHGFLRRGSGHSLVGRVLALLP